jgi:acetyl-CoA C-acetyltransferase
MSEEKANELNLKPLARVVSYADASQEANWFTTSPAIAINKALLKANILAKDVDYWELNEAFSVVGIINTQLLEIDANKVDVNGGAVALGHPLGSSGSRILVTLINVLKQKKSKIGVAGICNGGGGASAMIIENIDE